MYHSHVSDELFHLKPASVIKSPLHRVTLTQTSETSRYLSVTIASSRNRIKIQSEQTVSSGCQCFLAGSTLILACSLFLIGVDFAESDILEENTY